MLVQKTSTSVAKPSIKVRYVFDDDRDSTSNMELVEGTHFWWVPIVVFSECPSTPLWHCQVWP